MSADAPHTASDTQERSALWEFSLRVYADQRVRKACLALQDDFGADVNVLLLILWLASQGKALTTQGAEVIGPVSDSWQVTVLRPLRTLRRGMSAQPQVDPDRREILQQVKELELNAERREQRALEFAHASCVVHSDAAPHEAAAISFVAYEQLLQTRFPLTDLKALIGAVTAPDQTASLRTR